MGIGELRGLMPHAHFVFITVNKGLTRWRGSRFSLSRAAAPAPARTVKAS